MTVTKNSDCSEVYIESDHITLYISEDPANTTSLVLKVYKNCADDPLAELTLVIGDLDVANNRFVMVPSDLSQTDNFTDDVYKLALEVTTISSGDITTELGCLYVDCEIKCLLDTDLLNNPNSLAPAYHLTLQNLTECTDCECENACMIFNDLVSILELQQENTLSNDCTTC